MHVAERELTDEILERISRTVRETAHLTRCALARLVCGWMNWQDAAGRAKESSCRALLVKLERRGLIQLPAARPVSFEASATTVVRPAEKWLHLKSTLKGLSGIKLVIVNGCRAHSRVWRSMMKGMRSANPPCVGNGDCVIRRRLVQRWWPQLGQPALRLCRQAASCAAAATPGRGSSAWADAQRHP